VYGGNSFKTLPLCVDEMLYSRSCRFTLVERAAWSHWMGSIVYLAVVKEESILVPAGNRIRVVQPIVCHTDPTTRSPTVFGGYLSQICIVGDTDTIVDL
jgi:hypothetical protein